jgi:hypothetical protein
VFFVSVVFHKEDSKSKLITTSEDGTKGMMKSKHENPLNFAENAVIIMLLQGTEDAVQRASNSLQRFHAIFNKV